MATHQMLWTTQLDPIFVGEPTTGGNIHLKAYTPWNITAVRLNATAVYGEDIVAALLKSYGGKNDTEFVLKRVFAEGEYLQ